ncbi:wax ester synthase/diacylglycerol acyltransferase 7-like isoform X2 [Wolffia australiana]
MDADGALYDEPVSPCSRFYLGRYTDLSIDSFVTFQRPIDVVVVREALKSSAKIYPRLRSLVIEAGRGHRWKELAEIEIDNLLKILPEEDEEHAYNWDEDENNRYINEYLASLPSMNPLTRNSPPWEVHVLPRQRRSLVLRFHHSLGDCVSLLALLLFSCDASQEQASISSHGREGKERLSSAGSNAKYAGNSTLPSVQQQSEIEIERNERVMFSTREFDNEVLSRKVASLVLSLEDMKLVKNSVNAKINDVFVGIILYGISKYLVSKPCNVTQSHLCQKHRKGFPSFTRLIKLTEDLSGTSSFAGCYYFGIYRG